MCGNCCSGPAGYVLVSDEEVAALATRLSISVPKFLADYTHMTSEGRSLNEKKTAAGLDCIFLDRETMPGKAICGVYEDRPIQCRTWPFWPSVVRSERTWEQAKRTCPGMDQGEAPSTAEDPDPAGHLQDIKLGLYADLGLPERLSHVRALDASSIAVKPAADSAHHAITAGVGAAIVRCSQCGELLSPLGGLGVGRGGWKGGGGRGGGGGGCGARNAHRWLVKLPRNEAFSRFAS